MMDHRPRRSAAIAVLTAVFVLAQLVAVMLPGAPGAGRAHAAVPAAGHYFGLPTSRVVFDQTLAANASVSVKLRGIAGTGIPDSADVSALAGNLVVFNPTANGNVSVYPAGGTRPAVGQVYYYASDNLSNFIIAELAADGRATITNNSSASVRIGFNAQGYYTKAATGTATDNGATYAPLPGGRVLSTAEGIGVPNTNPLGPNGTLTFDLSGKAGLPEEGMGPAVLSVTARQPTAGGVWYQVFTAGGPRPAWAHASTDPNMGQRTTTVIVQPDADGKVSIYNQSGSASIHFLVDVQGWYVPSTGTAPGGTFTPLPVKRILDTAAGVGVPAAGPVLGEQILNLDVTGVGGVPSTGVHAVALNLLITGAETNGYLRVFPTGATQTTTVIVGYQRLRVAGNLVSTHLSADGKLSIRNISTGQVNLYADVYGYWKAPTKPQPPTNVTANVGDGEAFVSWTPPTNDGGATVKEYTVTASPGGATKTVNGNAPGAAFTDLTNGTEYTFTVKATNAVGTSEASAASPGVTPEQPRDTAAPYITELFARDQAARILWDPPKSGADGVVDYEIKAMPGGITTTVDGTAREAVVSGLTNGTEYRFTITPINANGRGVTSLESQALVPQPARAPTQPAGLMTVPLDGRIDVQWVPVVDGGSPVTNYTVTAEPGGHSITTAADTTVAALTGLDNGASYTVRVTAANKAGSSPASVSENVVPQANRAPQPPTSVTAAAGEDGVATVSWRPPGDHGTDPITGYTITTTPGGATTSVTGTSTKITGLDPDTAYSFTVTATSAAGTGGPSEQSSPVRPRVVVKQAPIVLDDAAAATLQAIRSDGTLIFSAPPPQVTSLKAGDLLMLAPGGAAPDGFFGRVSEVRTTSTYVAVTTVNATLAEAYTQADFSARAGAGGTAAASAMSGVPGATFAEPVIKGRTAAQLAKARDIGGNLEIRDFETVVITVTAKNGPGESESKKVYRGFDLALQVTLRGTPYVDWRDGAFYFGADVRYDITGHATVGYNLDFGDGIDKVLGSKDLARIPVVLPNGTPLVMVPRWVARVQASASGSIGYSDDISILKGRLQADCVSQLTFPTCSGIGVAPAVLSSDVNPEASGTFSIRLPLDFEVAVQGKVGPAVSFVPYVNFNADLYGGGLATGVFGFNIGMALNQSLLWDKSIWRKDDIFTPYSKEFWRIEYTGLALSPSSSEFPPGGEEAFSAKFVRVPEEEIFWRVSEGPGQISSNGVYSSTTAGFAVIEAYTEGDGYVGTASVLVAPGGPASPQGVTVRPAVRGISVSWVPPTADLTHYEIVAYPETGSAPPRRAPVDKAKDHGRMDDLQPGTAYHIRVRAFSKFGASAGAFPKKIENGAETEVLPKPLEIDLGDKQTTGAHDIARGTGDLPDSTAIAGSGGAFLDGLNLFFLTQARSNLAPAEIKDTAAGEAIYVVKMNLFTHRTELVSRDLDGRTPQAVAAAPTNQRSLSVSGDGSTVAYRDVYGRILMHRIYDNVTWAADIDAKTLPALSYDGKVASYAANAGGISVAARHEQGKRPQVLNSCGNQCQVITDIDMSDDGKKVIFSAVSDLGYYTLFLHDRNVSTTAVTDQLPNRGTVLEIADSGKISGDGNSIAFWYERRGETQGLAVKKLDGTRIGASHIKSWSPETSVSYPMDVTTTGTHVAYQVRNSANESADLLVLDLSGTGELPVAGNIGTSRPLTAQLTFQGNRAGLVYTLYPADGGDNSHPGVWSWIKV